MIQPGHHNIPTLSGRNQDVTVALFIGWAANQILTVIKRGMLVDIMGEKVLVVTLRLFEKDLRRHFVGEVQEITSSAIRVQGYSFVFDDATSQFVRHDELRIRIFSLIDAGLVINVLPGEADIENIRYSWDEKKRRFLGDNRTFKLNINEFSVNDNLGKQSQPVMHLF